MQMKQTDKDSFMKLFNKFSDDERLLSVTSLKYMEHMKNALENMDLSDISMEEAIAVCQIVNTNAFDNGVCLNISRFKHSCLANAEYVWNDDLETRDVRAIKNIKEGEEICLNYQATSSYLTRAERQKNILEGFHFSCQCVACELTETEINQLDMKCLRYEELVNKVNMYKRMYGGNQGKARFESLTLTDEVIDSLNKMYKLARDMKIVTRLTIIQDILKCVYFISLYQFQETGVKHFYEDSKIFASGASKLAKILFGETNSYTQVWNERSGKSSQ